MVLAVTIVSVANSRTEANEALQSGVTFHATRDNGGVVKKKSSVVFFEAEKELNVTHATTARRGGQRAAVWLPFGVTVSSKLRIDASSSCHEFLGGIHSAGGCRTRLRCGGPRRHVHVETVVREF